MKAFMNKARKIHRNQKGFTLIELLVVMAILALLVGLVVPNLFGRGEDADVVQIQRQHDTLRTAVSLYHMDTGAWPTEWSGAGIGTEGSHQLWFADDVSGWDGPYIDRPILQDNRWGGHWGVSENRRLNVTGADNTVAGGGVFFTVLRYEDVPEEVAEALDEAMDDGVRTTGAVQYGGHAWPHNHVDSGGPSDDANFLEIIIARRE